MPKIEIHGGGRRKEMLKAQAVLVLPRKLGPMLEQGSYSGWVLRLQTRRLRLSLKAHMPVQSAEDCSGRAANPVCTKFLLRMAAAHEGDRELGAHIQLATGSWSPPQAGRWRRSTE